MPREPRPDELALRYPLFLSAHTFAQFLVEHGFERSLVTLAQVNFGKRRRKPSGIECDNCLRGHNAPCCLLELCDCLCHP